MNKEKMRKNYRLMNKLLKRKFVNLEIDNSSMTTTITKDTGIIDFCTGELALATAIAKQTNALMYIENNKIVLYTTNTKRDLKYYLTWSNREIKRLIEEEKACII